MNLITLNKILDRCKNIASYYKTKAKVYSMNGISKSDFNNKAKIFVKKMISNELDWIQKN